MRLNLFICNFFYNFVCFILQKIKIMLKRIIAISIILLISYHAYSQSIAEQSRKFNKLLAFIEALYVDSVDMEKLVEVAIVNMLKEMDPHSIYISKDEVQRMNEPLEGSFEGIGIQFRIMEDTLVVVGVISGGPSERIGLFNGDRIITVDGDNIAGVEIQNSDVTSMLRGEKGTRVDIEVVRRGVKGVLDFAIIRDRIPIYSVDANYIIDGKIGYVKLNRFAKTTDDELDEVFNNFRDNKIKDIILDLSGNTGGYMDKSISLADEFLTKDKVIVFTDGQKISRTDYNSTRRGRFHDGKLIVIVDEGSASASEIVSGAIQDWDRGVVLGRRTFGKGLVQRPVTLTDESVVRLTIAQYYTPTGRPIQKPYECGYDDYIRDISNRWTKGEFISADSIDFPDSLKYETLVFKKTIYGGGGIMPDEFIPIDTAQRSEYHIHLLRRGVLFTFISRYVDNNRTEINEKYPDFETFKNNFVVDKNILEQINEMAIEEKIYQDSLETATPEQIKYMENHIKSLVAGDLWETNNFWQIFNNYNQNYKRALEIITDDKLYNMYIKGK